MWGYIARRVARHGPGAGDGGAHRLPDAAADARAIRRRSSPATTPPPQRSPRSARASGSTSRSLAVRHLGRQHADRRFRRIVLLQGAGDRADRRPGRPDPGARHRHHHHHACWSPCRSACSPPTARAPGSTALVMAFSVLGFSVPVFVIGYFLIWLLSVKLGCSRCRATSIARASAVPPPADPAELTLSRDLHRADRADDARQRAGGAGRGLHPHRHAKGLTEPRSC